MAQNTPSPTAPTSSLPGVIYVGRTPGEMTTVLGKVGQVASPEFLGGRLISYRVADRIFHFEVEAAFAVEVPPGVSVLDVETRVHSDLEMRGLDRYGENFMAPESSMTFLARMTEEALGRVGYKFTSLNIDELQARAQALNSQTWQKLRKRKKNKGYNPNDAWLTKHCAVSTDILSMTRPRDYVRNVLALGYLLKDLGAGSGIDCIQVPLVRGGNLKVYPGTLEAALFEHKAEVDLNLDSTTSFSACPVSLDQIPVSPNAMTMVLGQNLEYLEIPNTFLPPTKECPEEVRFSPDNLAALGMLGGRYDEYCLYEGLGVKASLPLELHPYVKKYPHLLPGYRFWTGLLFCREMGFRIQDFDLPESIVPLLGLLSNAALVMEKEAGLPVPETVQAWVAHAWFPSIA